MSPLAASQYLPRGVNESDTLAFDSVIFDEHISFPQDAIPAIARAPARIVVGDQQQLPPSNFFRKVETWTMMTRTTMRQQRENRLVGVESILDVLVGMVAAWGVSAVHLGVHYRSQHDTLIRYSNHYF